MKNFVLFAGILGSAVWMLGAVPLDLSTVEADSSSGSSEEKEWPKQTQCTDLTALPFKQTTMPGATTFKLYVGRIMTLPYTPVVDPNAPNNLCSPLSYVIDSCQGTEIYVKINNDGSKIVKMASYNKVTNNAVCYTQSAEIQEEKYHIFKAKVNKMALIDDKGELIEVPSIPQMIQDLDDTMIATLKYGKDLSYAIYSSCLKNAAWVAYSEQTIKNTISDTLKAEIDQSLSDLGFDPTQFIEIPTTIPINLDKCFVDTEVPVAV